MLIPTNIFVKELLRISYVVVVCLMVGVVPFFYCVDFETVQEAIAACGWTPLGWGMFMFPKHKFCVFASIKNQCAFFLVALCYLFCACIFLFLFCVKYFLAFSHKKPTLFLLGLTVFINVVLKSLKFIFSFKYGILLSNGWENWITWTMVNQASGLLIVTF